MNTQSILSVDDDLIFNPSNRRDSALRLLDGEKVFEKITPHFLSFYNLYFIWVYLMLLSGVILLYYDVLIDNLKWILSGATGVFKLPFGDLGMLSEVGFFSNIQLFLYVLMGQASYIINSSEFILAILWLVPIAFFSTVFSILRIEWKWILVMIGVGAASILITFLLELPGESVYYISIIISILGCVGVDLYRRAHRFYITNYRIITELKFLGVKQNTLSYDKINNLIVEQSLIARIFDFGTVIPITASGLGMGEDSASVSIGAAGRLGGKGFIGGAVTGGRSIDIPRTRSQYALFGVSNPKRIYHILSKFMQEYVEAPYLKDMSVNIRKLLEAQEKRVGKDGELL